MSSEIYNTVDSQGESLYKEKGSKFLGLVQSCHNENEAKKIIQALREEHPNAVHVCFAWRFGIENYSDRYSDDGEPNNSAGKPIFGQIINAEITNVLITVVRYYGGTKLGVGGLISAYKTTAAEAIENTIIVQKELTYECIIRYDYSETGKANIILSKNNVDIIENGFDSLGPFIKFAANKIAISKVKIALGETKSIKLEEE
ncbi:MAG: YigZ family protein [Crocinitomicaceae bacterium]|nr:YigZ family protein [Crocinitomicaceae bacterium]